MTSKINILLQDGDTSRPLDYAVTGSVNSTIRISGTLPSGFQILNIRPDGRAGLDGAGRDITAFFSPVETNLWQAEIAFLHGENQIIIQDAQANGLAMATMFNYSSDLEDSNGNQLLDIDEDINDNGLLDMGEDQNDNQLLDFDEDQNGDGELTINEDTNANGVLDPGEDFNGNGQIDSLTSNVGRAIEPVYTEISGTTLSYQTNTLSLDFVDDATDVAISDFLRMNDLRPVDLMVDNTFVTQAKLMEIVPSSTEDILALVKSLNNLPVDGFDFFPHTDNLPVRPPLEVAILNLGGIVPSRAAGEAMPKRLVKGERTPPSVGNVGDDYRLADGSFDNRGAANDYDELNIAWHHFFMDTFAAHRLVELMVTEGTTTTRPVLAVVDTGLGNGTGDVLVDIPMARIVRMTDCQANPCQPQPLLTSITDTWTSTEIQTIGGIQIHKAISGNHGTSVAHLAVGGGQRVLGLGKHVTLRPIKAAGNMDRRAYARGLQSAAADRLVRVIVLSLMEPGFDTNGDGKITNIIGGANERTNAVNHLNAVSHQWQLAINTLVQVNSSKILVIAAGNMAQTTSFSLLAGAQPAVGLQGLFNAPQRGTRAAGAANSLVVGVGNATLDAAPLGQEKLAGNSNFGPHISVTALSGKVPSLDPAQRFQSFGGTSGAAPQVAGLMAELIYLDDNSATVGPFEPLQIIELVEATADDLGSLSAKHPFTNSNPGNGSDDAFGHGRINAWKATLSAVNGGVAIESHPEGNGFASLNRINEANTDWYGFKIHSPIRGATIWVDGKRIIDRASTVPGSNINAYAGVPISQTMLIGVDDDRDGVLDEDPTSGIVPSGSESNFIATFSIERADLISGNGNRVLQLRRPGETEADAPFYNLALDLAKMREGKIPGVVFDDFVFEVTLPDFGDAAAKLTSLEENGARHLNHLFEYFGNKNNTGDPLTAVSPELSERYPHDPDGISNRLNVALGPPLVFDLDRYDDGITFYPLTYLPGSEKGRADIRVCVTAPGKRYDRSDQDKQIFVNGWIDWDTDGIWEEGATREHVVSGLRLAPVVKSDSSTNWLPVEANGAISNTVTINKHCAKYEAIFTLPVTLGKGRLESRWRIDYGENSGSYTNTTFSSLPGLKLAAGPARYGEVEDYVIGSDFGDAPDPNYHTRKGSNGPRHLSFYREWIGSYQLGNASASREPDACKTNGSDQDGSDNLKNDCSGKDEDMLDNFTVKILGPTEFQVNFEVSSMVQGYGFTSNNFITNTLQEDCTLKLIAKTPVTVTTPVHHQKHMRYDISDPTKRLYVSLWADWDGKEKWDQLLIPGQPIDPADFGGDRVYTLGEPFTDTNQNGVWNKGEGGGKDEDFKDIAGKPSRPFSCVFDTAKFTPPVSISPYTTVWLRLRLDYGENVGQMKFISKDQPYEEEPLPHKPAGSDGGAVWGEVEDISFSFPPITKSSKPDTAIPGEPLQYTIKVHGNPNLTEPTQAQVKDRLPDLLEYQGDLTCSSGACDYNSDTRTVEWQGELTGSSVVTITFNTVVPIASVPLDWPEIVNQVELSDGVATVIAEDVTPMQCIPIKRAQPDRVTTGQSIQYTIVAPLNPELTEAGNVTIQDPVPQIFQNVENIVCLPEESECDFDPETGTVFLNSMVEPGEQAVLEFTAVVQDNLSPGSCPPEIINQAQIFDGKNNKSVTTTTALDCDQPAK